MSDSDDDSSGDDFYVPVADQADPSGITVCRGDGVYTYDTKEQKDYAEVNIILSGIIIGFNINCIFFECIRYLAPFLFRPFDFYIFLLCLFLVALIAYIMNSKYMTLFFWYRLCYYQEDIATIILVFNVLFLVYYLGILSTFQTLYELMM